MSVFIQPLSAGPLPVAGGVTEGCPPPLGGGGGGGADVGAGPPPPGVFVGAGVGVLVNALLVGVDVGQPFTPGTHGVAVNVGVGGRGVFVGSVPPVLLSVAPVQLASGQRRTNPLYE